MSCNRVTMVSSKEIFLLCLLVLASNVPVTNAVRGDGGQQEERRLPKANADYFRYSRGRGGSSKQAEIPPTDAPSGLPVPSTSPTRKPSSAPSSAPPTPYQYSYEEVKVAYNVFPSLFWPSDSLWQSELASRLSSGARLINNIYSAPVDAYNNMCPWDGSVESWQKGGNGLCMYHNNCEFRFCNLDGQRVVDLPVYSVDVRTPGDIVAAMEFAGKYNIQVSIKTTGHSKYTDALVLALCCHP